ncbi:hypothetical protein M413DRAFT_279009 [Hebeloma cylindrosporum]|uniref:CCD97-like C-terminal domain-containing protein n=1 Tax=Hebeloma cylindrosporum TaxID=76867 RepID=A0A0C3C0J0_HEBCY|nr:hypothetical protein M413DRAFT_279009 [Hebeloma cylindrosporum h7]
MVKFATSLLVAALVAAPAFASIDWDQIDARELAAYEEVFGRELADIEATVFGRDYDELFTRHPDDLGLESREYEDIASRSVASKIRSGFRKAFGFVKSVLFKREEGQNGVFAREYEEIDARDLEDLYERYADELEARAPGFFQHILQDGMRVAKAETPAAEAEPAPEPAARDFDDLLERDFFDEDLVERDLDFDLDLVQRDFDEDLYGREYVDDLYERDFDLDLVERELFDLEERSFDDLD